MTNNWFQFKQFIVEQDKCAMKVCTDACIFGAYVALKEKDTNNDETNILDIGTGTGLLSLMMAQKVKGNIEAVEIEKNAYEQAIDNFENSVWKSRLTVFNADISKLEISKKYDIIISNPPFFANSLKSINRIKNLAKHTTSLPLNVLSSLVAKHLMDKGKFYILLPFEVFEAFENIATQNQLSLIKRLNIRHSISSVCFRTIGVFTKAAVSKTNSESLIIKDEKSDYTTEFKELLKDYYLYL